MFVSPLLAIFGVVLGVVLAICAIVYIGVPVLKVVGAAIAATLRGIGWLLAHVAGFVVGMLRDAVRLVGALIATILFVPLLAGSVVIGRWSSAGHFASSVMRELRVGAACLYRVVLQRPLHLLLLDGLLEGVEQRVPEALAEAPGADRPNRRIGQFDGYTIVGSLRPGGSGAKLYVAEPSPELRMRRPGMPQQVVIKTFAITDGSSLPQIVRESRALDAARQMGLIVDHGLDEQRFFYVMPYHPGESLGLVTRQLHGESAGDGLAGATLRQGLGYVVDLVETLRRYHQGGLWHKDVKPENIIVHAGRAHLVDLGLVTPLRSAMTLTTHGTEYFRDPEMVRLALRGVKVHQVDGAKFDVYACGAVLYFLLENTFPAHGGLSAFAKRSPESLRWIVRRAMADYSKRYETADLLLADLRHVMAAPDAFAVRPADLPSFRGALLESQGHVHVGATQAPEAMGAEGVGGARQADAPSQSRWREPVVGAGMAAAPVALGAVGTAAGRLEVTNWWTGAFRMAGASEPTGGGAVPQGFVPAGAGASGLSQEDRRRLAPPPPPPALGRVDRPSAAAQRTAARHRAQRRRRDAERHVAARLHRPATPGVAVTVLVLLVIGAVLGGTLLAATWASETREGLQAHARAVEATAVAEPPIRRIGVAATAMLPGQAPQAPAAPLAPRPGTSIPVDVANDVQVQAAPAAPCEPLRVVLVNAHADPAAPTTIAAIDQAVQEQEAAGAAVCREDVETIAQLLVLLPRWARGDQAADAAIEELLAQREYAAILWITGGGRDARDQVGVELVRAERSGAEERRGACGGR